MAIPEIIERMRLEGLPVAKLAAASASPSPSLFTPTDATATPTPQDDAAPRKRRRNSTRTEIFTGLDVGTTKVCAIIGQVDGRKVACI